MIRQPCNVVNTSLLAHGLALAWPVVTQMEVTRTEHVQTIGEWRNAWHHIVLTLKNAVTERFGHSTVCGIWRAHRKYSEVIVNRGTLDLLHRITCQELPIPLYWWTSLGTLLPNIPMESRSLYNFLQLTFHIVVILGGEGDDRDHDFHQSIYLSNVSQYALL
jgi:hypothetical protein